MSVFWESTNTIFQSLIFIISSYLPKLFAGTLIIFIGLIVASLLKDLLLLLFQYLRLERWFEEVGVVKEKQLSAWPNIFGELVRWTVIFIFLMSAIEVWGIPKVADLLNQLLLFLPNVFVAVIIGWAGIIVGKISCDIVRHSFQGVGKREALLLGNLAKYAIFFFVALIILTQLGVAAELVKILFTGIVGMVALGFGLAFGLGGQEEAKRILKKILRKI